MILWRWSSFHIELVHRQRKTRKLVITNASNHRLPIEMLFLFRNGIPTTTFYLRMTSYEWMDGRSYSKQHKERRIHFIHDNTAETHNVWTMKKWKEHFPIIKYVIVWLLKRIVLPLQLSFDMIYSYWYRLGYSHYQSQLKFGEYIAWHDANIRIKKNQIWK